MLMAYSLLDLHVNEEKIQEVSAFVKEVRSYIEKNGTPAGTYIKGSYVRKFIFSIDDVENPVWVAIEYPNLAVYRKDPNTRCFSRDKFDRLLAEDNKILDYRADLQSDNTGISLPTKRPEIEKDLFETYRLLTKLNPRHPPW
jgi:hypothetical protein